MLVYGDSSSVAAPGRLIEALRASCMEALLLEQPAEQGEILRGMLINAGELAQGLLDAAFVRAGCDELGPLQAACGALTLSAAQLWLAGQSGAALEMAPFSHALDQIEYLELPDAIAVRAPEGYAFYALYPELYARAALALRDGVQGPLFVLGLRSIGTSLAAVVAAVVSAPEPFTLRPTGHPFRREICIGPRLAAALLIPGASYAIVDEGPGLSGSSFGAVADWLEDRGVPPDRLHFFPGHKGDLWPHASERHRQRWHSARRHVAEFDEVLVRDRDATLSVWLEGQVMPVQDLSAGRWRARFFPSEADYPPSHSLSERRKVLYHMDGRSYLAKFAGLGRHGQHKLARAQALHAAGFVPPLRGLRHGFLISEWLHDARPLRPDEPFDRTGLLDTVACYLSFLARERPARMPGASPRELLLMARHNTEQCLGPLAAECDALLDRLPALECAFQPVETDNRLHLWEWLRLPGGGFLKADAVDHHAEHDLVGPQDLGWDIAGAAVELRLSADELSALTERIAATSSYRPSPPALHFYRVCYLAFQAGYYFLAAKSVGVFDAAEGARLAAAAQGYGHLLRNALAR